jgi:hypothetical protein
MANVLSSIIGIFLMLFILIPLTIFIFVLFFMKTDVDQDGRDDTKWFWEK